MASGDLGTASPFDGLAQVCREKLAEDPFSGAIFIFRNRSGTSIRLLVFDGRGFWLAQKRLSQGRFKAWPKGDRAEYILEPHQVHVLLAAGNPEQAQGAPIWRAVTPSG